MNRHNKEFMNSCESFKDYADINEYKKDIHICLKCSTWKYTDSLASELMERNEEFIRESFEDRVPAADTAAEVGYCCG